MSFLPKIFPKFKRHIPTPRLRPYSSGGATMKSLFIAALIVAGFYAVRTLPEVHASVIGNFFESEGSREIRKAEADRIRAEAEIRRMQARADIARQAALLESAGYPPRRTGSGTPLGLAFLVAVVAVGAYWAELRRREAREDEIRRLQIRLAVAEAAARARGAFVRSYGLPEIEFGGKGAR